jgi:hypothetical protein
MRTIIRKLVENQIIWKILNFCYRIFYRFQFEKELIQIEIKQKAMLEKEAVLKKKFINLTVADGPFKGMMYPDFIAYGSAIYPKLIGCYESELHLTLEELLKTDYKSIIDIGCAEGYYAVGLAMRKPNAIVYAYDIDKKAISFCEKMMKLNHLSNINFGDFCNQDTLKKLDFGDRSLVICDCEGYEKVLFSGGLSSWLKKCDILIELHDLYDETISPSVLEEFNLTHNAKFIHSENTFSKIRKFESLNDLSDDDVKLFFSERTGIMRWVLLIPKL